VFVGGGMAQVDAKVAVTVYDCSMNATPDACAAGSESVNQTSLPQKKVDAWKKLGQGFAAAGGGVVYAINPQLGIQGNINLMYMLGSSGPVLEPSLGLVYGL
jgi:hypothetical protein